MTGPDERELARRALYRPEASDADRARYATLVAEQVPVQPVPEVLPHPRRTPWVLAATLGVAAALAAVVLLAPRPEAPTARSAAAAASSSAAAGGSAERAGTLGWQVANTVAVGNDLDGATAVQVPPITPGEALLLVVRCPAEDRSFQVALTDGERHLELLYGACGAPARVPLGPATGRPLEVLVTTRGVQPFDATVLAR